MRIRTLIIAGLIATPACGGPSQPESTESAESALISCPPGFDRKCAYSPDVRRVECECVPAPPRNPRGLSWPIACNPNPGGNCTITNWPDPDGNGVAYNCNGNWIAGHTGVDVAISWEQMDAGVNVTAAADGQVVFVADGKFDRCQAGISKEADCVSPGTTVCTPTCGPGVSQPCSLCMAGGNVVLIRHDGVPGVVATRYDHLKKNSITVSTGQWVTRGQVIGQAGSAGNSSGPHLHFDVWNTWGNAIDPWLSTGCGTNTSGTLWLVQNK